MGFKLISSIITAGAVALALSLSGCASMGGQSAEQTEMAKLQEQAQLAASATTVLQKQMLQPSTRRIPRTLVDQARCIAVFPQVTQAGLIVGGQRGTGLISCRQRSGDFTNAPPAVYQLSSASFGLQAGAARRSVVLLFTTQQSVNAVLDSLVKMGSQMAVNAGPSGYDRPIDKAAPIVAYGIARKGLFGGLSLGGGKVEFDTDANTAIYGNDPTPREVLLQTPEVPESMQAYMDTLQKFATDSADNS